MKRIQKKITNDKESKIYLGRELRIVSKEYKNFEKQVIS